MKCIAEKIIYTNTIYFLIYIIYKDITVNIPDKTSSIQVHISFHNCFFFYIILFLISSETY